MRPRGQTPWMHHIWTSSRRLCLGFNEATGADPVDAYQYPPSTARPRLLQ